MNAWTRPTVLAASTDKVHILTLRAAVPTKRLRPLLCTAAAYSLTLDTAPRRGSISHVSILYVAMTNSLFLWHETRREISIISSFLFPELPRWCVPKIRFVNVKLCANQMEVYRKPSMGIPPPVLTVLCSVCYLGRRDYPGRGVLRGEGVFVASLPWQEPEEERNKLLLMKVSNRDRNFIVN